MKAILLVDHGSMRKEANEMLIDVAKLVQSMAGDAAIIRYAHMELAEPTIAAGIASCVEAGATDVVVFPYMLSPGRHSTTDIPRMVNEAAPKYPDVRFSVTPPFGINEKLGEVILSRAQIDVAPVVPD
jgi:sirohydrochlorin ferrochelatase